MSQLQLRPVTSREGTGLGISLSSADRYPEYNLSTALRQAEIDTVALLAARSRVAPATIRAQLAAWRVGGAHG